MKPATPTPTSSPLIANAARVIASYFLVAAAISGCAGNYHFSQVLGERYFKTNIDTYPVSINEVDGRSYLGSEPVLVDPGLRQIVVQGPPTFVDLQETRTIALDVKPCTRYYLVAVKSNRLSNDFSVRVDFEQPVPGCTPPPALLGARANAGANTALGGTQA